MTRAGLAAALLLVMGGAGCGNGAQPTAPVTPPVPPPSPVVELPADPEVLFLVIDMRGGFMPIGYTLGLPPLFALSVAGELWSRAPVPEIYPGPLVPGIVHSRVDPAGVQTVLRLIAELGLPDVAVDDLEMIRQPEDGPILADAPGVEVRFTSPDGPHRLFVEAFGSSYHRDPRVDLVRDLVERLGGTAQSDGDRWGGERVQVWAGPDTGHDETVLRREPWPLPDPPPPPEEYFDCQVFEGPITRELMVVFEAADHGVRWEYEGELHQVLARWLIPGEPGCES